MRRATEHRIKCLLTGYQSLKNLSVDINKHPPRLSAEDFLEMVKEIEGLKAERDAVEMDFAVVAARNPGVACEYCSEHIPGYGCAKCEFKWRGYMPNDRQ